MQLPHDYTVCVCVYHSVLVVVMGVAGSGFTGGEERKLSLKLFHMCSQLGHLCVCVNVDYPDVSGKVLSRPGPSAIERKTEPRLALFPWQWCFQNHSSHADHMHGACACVGLLYFFLQCLFAKLGDIEKVQRIFFFSSLNHKSNILNVLVGNVG